jgi:hypothetical protein
MRVSIRDRILALLKEEGPLTSLEIVEKLGLTDRQVYDANCCLKKQGRIISDERHPAHFSLGDEVDIKSKGKNLLSKSVIKEKTGNIMQSFELGDYVILYFTDNSEGPKMRAYFKNKADLLQQFAILQETPNIVKKFIFKKVEVIQKFELKI